MFPPHPLDTDEELSFDPSSSSIFPTSSARDEPISPPSRPRSPPPFHDPQPPSCTTSYPTHVPPLIYVEPGVLDTGALTITHPEVRSFLAQSHAVPPPPPPIHKPLFVLAALALFYRPNQPAHWLFWSRKKRNETAKIVQAVLNTPNLVHPPICWLGISENLNIVANLQHGWRDHLSDFEWFAPYAEPRPSSSPSKTRMSLRKRKQQSTPSSSSPSQPATPEQSQHATASVSHPTPEAVNNDGCAPESPPKKRQRTSHVASQQVSVERTQVRSSERLRRAAEATTTPPSVSLEPEASRLPSCAPSDSSTVVIDSPWPNMFLDSADPGSPSDLSAITMVEDVDDKRALVVVVACQDSKTKRTRKGKADAAKRVSTPAIGTRSSARQRRKKAETVALSAKMQTKRGKVTTRSKKRARRRH